MIFIQPFIKSFTQGEYSNLACSIVLGFKSKSLPVKYSYLSKLLEDNADILAAFLQNHIVLNFA